MGERALGSRVAVTLSVIFGVLFLQHLQLPFVGFSQSVLGGDFVPIVGAPAFTFLHLGIGPVLTAFILVEIAALLIPRLAGHRFQGTAPRKPLTVAAYVLAAGFTAIQAGGILRFLQGSDFALLESTQVFAVLVCLFLGTAALVAGALLVERFGIGSGFSVVIASLIIGKSSGFVEVLRDAAVTRGPSVPWITLGFILLGASVAIVFFRNEGIGGTASFPLLPLCGLIPIFLVNPLEQVVSAALSIFALDAPHFLLSGDLAARLPSQLIVVAATAIILALLFNPLAASASLLRKPVAVVAKDRRSAAGKSVIALCAVYAIAAYGIHFYAAMLALPSLLALFFVVADVVLEMQFRRQFPDAVSAWPLHRTYAVAPVLRELRAHQIPAHIRAVHHRSLFQFFGPFIPMAVLVRRQDVDRAQRLIEDRLEAPAERWEPTPFDDSEEPGQDRENPFRSPRGPVRLSESDDGEPDAEPDDEDDSSETN